MLLDLVGKLRNVQLIAGSGSKLGAAIQVVVKMLIGIRAGGSIFREGLKDIQVAIGCGSLAQTPLDHRELVVSGSRVPADTNILPEQFCGLRKLPGGNPEISQFQKCVGIVRIESKGLLIHRFGGRGISLALSDITQIEEAGTVVRVQLQSLLKILLRLIKAPQMTVGKSQKGIRTCRRFDLDQLLECLDSFVDLAGHEIALAESGKEIRLPRSDCKTGFKQRYRILEIVLRDADLSHEVDD